MIQNLKKNTVLFYLGHLHLTLFFALFLAGLISSEVILGINAIIKPMKFALSIWIYAWSMSLISNYIADSRKVKLYSWGTAICMIFEQFAITFQAARGELSHFNVSSTFGIVLFALMGVFILVATLWTAYITLIFIKQRSYNLSAPIVLGIKLGLIYFVIFSLFGGYISSLQGHTVGSADGGEGLWFLNWSIHFGDLRVAHFFGIHSLQLIPLFAITTSKYIESSIAIRIIKLFAFIYLIFILHTLSQGLQGVPFIG